MIATRRRALALVACSLLIVACGSGDDGGGLTFDSRPTGSTEPGAASSSAPATTTPDGSASASEIPASETPASEGSASEGSAEVGITIDASAPGEPISPLILGLSSTLTAEEFGDLGTSLNSWGGNPSTRYNYMIGHAWNHGADYEFRNTNYGGSGDVARGFLDVSAAAGIESRVAVPTLGWVASNDDDATCSFPDGSGGCLNAEAAGNCREPGEVGDPETANVQSTPEGVAEWIGGLIDDGYDLRFIAMDNEPEIWGLTHYDVHPECPTYEEILDKYLTYARAVREVAPDAELTGPVLCCWFDYWNTAPGPADGSGQDFLEWFLRQVKAHDDEYGQRTLDVVDVHYYPQSDVFNENTDEETSARRLRSTRSLWDLDYTDESWIDDPIAFIPRVMRTIERSYPGTPLFISEWNFGADASLNGALAIADVLGIYGREGVYAAAYWRNPEVGSPGYYAFKMHGNYDDRGSRFGGQVVPVQASDGEKVGAYAALDESTGLLRVLLINKQADDAIGVELTMAGFEPAADARRFTYGPDDPEAIVEDTVAATGVLTLPASSITILELDPR